MVLDAAAAPHQAWQHLLRAAAAQYGYSYA